MLEAWCINNHVYFGIIFLYYDWGLIDMKFMMLMWIRKRRKSETSLHETWWLHDLKFMQVYIWNMTLTSLDSIFEFSKISRCIKTTRIIIFSLQNIRFLESMTFQGVYFMFIERFCDKIMQQSRGHFEISPCILASFLSRKDIMLASFVWHMCVQACVQVCVVHAIILVTLYFVKMQWKLFFLSLFENI